MYTEIQVNSLWKRGGGGCCLVAKSGLTLLRPMDCSPPGSSVHEGGGNLVNVYSGSSCSILKISRKHKNWAINKKPLFGNYKEKKLISSLDKYFIFGLLWKPKIKSIIFSSYIYRRRQWHPTPVLLPGEIPWMEEPGGLQSMGSLRVISFHF